MFIETARNIDDSCPWSGPLDPRLLGALYYLKIGGGNEGKRYLRCATLAAEAGYIPHNISEFEFWFHCAFVAASRRTQHEIRTKRGARNRADIFARMLRQIEMYPTAFRKWREVVPTAVSKIRRHKTVNLHELREMESFPPFTLKEIDKLLHESENYQQALAVIVYLSGGFRSGEGERVTSNNLVGERLKLREIVTKTTTHRMPHAPMAMRAALHFKNEQVELPSCAERKRFRPTVAVNLNMAKVPPLLIIERIGHASMQMLMNHYCKVTPEDWGHVKTAEAYLGVGELNVGIWKCDESAWDKYVLKRLLQQAVRFGAIEPLKEVILREAGLVQTELICDSF